MALQVKALKGPNLVGLAMGGPAPGESPPIEHAGGSKVLAIQGSPASALDAGLPAAFLGALGGQSQAASSGSLPQAAPMGGDGLHGGSHVAALGGAFEPEVQAVMDLSPPALDDAQGISLIEGFHPVSAQVSGADTQLLVKAPPESAAERRSRLMLAASSAAEEAEAAQEAPERGALLTATADEAMPP